MRLLFRKVRTSHGPAGFTLVEIMIVVAVIGLLAMIAIPSMSKARSESRKAVCINNLRVIETAKEMWAFDAMAGPRATPRQAELAPYMRKVRGRRGRAVDLNCPIGRDGRFGRSYRMGRMDQRPTCKLDPDHRLP